MVVGTHPEYLHLLSELQRRKDRKLLLASRWADRTKAFATHKRKVEEHTIWAGWNEERDGVRDDLVAEANAKRRKLEREKRSIDQPRIGERVRAACPALSSDESSTDQKLSNSSTLR